MDIGKDLQRAFNDGYNKAIDDFIKEIESEYDNDACPNVSDYLDYQISLRDLFKIADRLKEYCLWAMDGGVSE